MPSEPTLSAERQARLNDVLAEYLQEVEAGREPDRAGLAARHPDLADELREFFANHDQLASLAGPAPGAPTVATAPAAGAPGRLSDYELLGEIARGGMGV